MKQIKDKSVAFRLGAFLICLLVLWLPFATPIYLIFSSDPNLTTILTMGLLFIAFLLLQIFWGHYIYQQPNILQYYGLVRKRKIFLELVYGLAIGYCFCKILFIIEAIFGWVVIQPPSSNIFKLIIEGLISALGIGLAEELVFRGWILTELQRDYSNNTALLVSSGIFAVAHFIKPLSEIIRTFITFPALFILGLILVWAKGRTQNRLGLSIGLHSGLVWSYYILNVGKQIEYTGQAPTWVTGIDGNPMAGILGLIFLGLLAILMWNSFRRTVIKDL
ncbi:MAG: type II CAAX endopeptidase family protein [Xenococcaceae cyanobacterium MO_234.B1]|nr:type II CAAX endopeptidase family protein [Xenococcaceae cyanobacterium MO_234.B1]